MAVDFITDAFGADASDALGRVVAFVLTLAFTWIVRRIAPYFIRRTINAAFRAITMVRRFEEQLKGQLAHAVTPPLRLFITTIGIGLALLVVDLSQTANTVIIDAAEILLLFSVFWGVYRVVDVVAVYYVRRTRNAVSMLDETITNFVRQMVKAVIFAFGFVVIMQQLGYDLGGVLAGLGLGGLAVALAAQDALSNFIGYFAIIADSAYKVGDLITINETEGFVEEFSFRSTRLRKRDRSLVIIPNQTMASATMINWSRLQKRQLKLTLGVTYSTTTEQIEAVVDDIRSMLRDHERVTRDRILVEFVEFNSSSLDILIICLVNTILWEDLLAVKTDINLRLMKILQRHDVQVAFPTRTVHMYNESLASVNDNPFEEEGRERGRQ